jgi:DNA-binding NarL/FixJ family response regulator
VIQDFILHHNPHEMTRKKKITVIIADDHTLVRRGLVSLLSLSDNIEVVAEVGDGREAVQLALRLRPDVVMMDLSMPNLNGFEAIRQIKKQAPLSRILVLSAYDNEEYVHQTIEYGADGYMLKNTTPEQLNDAISTVHSGRPFYSPSVGKFAEEARSNKHGDLTSRGAKLLSGLTAREREILQLIAEAHSHQEIAQMLHISVRTVDTHRNNIIQKLGLHDTASLVTYAIKNGIVIIQR